MINIRRQVWLWTSLFVLSGFLSACITKEEVAGNLGVEGATCQSSPECTPPLQCIDATCTKIPSADAASSESDAESAPTLQDGNICIWDACMSDDDCASQEMCFFAKDYDWGRCFWTEQFGCEVDEDCSAGSICGKTNPSTTAFYAGLPETMCQYGCNDDYDCQLMAGTRCVTSKWGGDWTFCADGCNEDADCVSEEEPLLRCLDDDQHDYLVCMEYCTTDEECVAQKGEDARCSPHNSCLVGNQCVDDTECATGEYCDYHAGCNSCEVDGDCRPPPHNNGDFCEDGRCVSCREDSDCGKDRPACTAYGYCAECSEDSHCADMHQCNYERCEYKGCASDQDCMATADQQQLGELKEHLVCVMRGEGDWSYGECKVGCAEAQTCGDLRGMLPSWMSQNYRGESIQNWDSLNGVCAPPCVGGTCDNY